MYCSNCGTKNEENSKFCTNCGKELKKVEEKKKTKKEEIKEQINITDIGTKVNNKPVVSTPPKDSNGIASIVLGVISLFIPFIPIPIVGLILGIKTNDKGSKAAGIILNAIGIVISLFAILVFALIIIFAVVDGTSNPIESIIEPTPVIEDQENTKYVGDDKFGYVRVPKDWIKFYDPNSGNAIQYASIGSERYIITLNLIEQNVSVEAATEAIASGLNEEGATTTYNKTKIGSYDGYTIDVEYAEGVYLKTYIFKTKDEKLHYVAIEGPDKNNESFKIPLTFSLSKGEEGI